MHINDRKPDTGGQAPLVWHDYRNETLNKAFAELAHRRNVLKKRSQRTPFWKRWYVYVPLTLISGITGSLALAVVLALGGAIFALAMDVVPPWVAKKRLHALLLEIRHGKFGYAVMWEDERMWEILAAALKPHRIQLTELFRDDELNKRATDTVTAMLADTWQDRRVLSMHGATSPHGSSSLRTLSDHAYETARTIDAIYGDYQAEQHNT